MRTAIYLRVSTEDQADKYGIDVQRERCHAMATAKGWDVVQTFVDEGVSGMLTEYERDGLSQMLEAGKNGEIDALIVSSLDRIGRNARIILNVAEKFETHGIELVSCKESLDTSSPAGRFVLTMFAALAQLERDNIVQRTTDGRNQRGRIDGERGGRMPMGYKRVFSRARATSKVEIDSFWAMIVQRIFGRREKGETLRQIADGLNNDEVLTQHGGSQWRASSIRSVLGNEKKYRGGKRGESAETWPIILQ